MANNKPKEQESLGLFLIEDTREVVPIHKDKKGLYIRIPEAGDKKYYVTHLCKKSIGGTRDG